MVGLKEMSWSQSASMTLSGRCHDAPDRNTVMSKNGMKRLESG
jgi:hypothetical protein